MVRVANIKGQQGQGGKSVISRRGRRSRGLEVHSKLGVAWAILDTVSKN